jgi:tRNA nucleotidyltransferase (CCA-adding enzyme)
MTAIGDHLATGRWEHFPHDADIGVRGYGATPGEACEQAALAMRRSLIRDRRLEQSRWLEAPRLDLLLVDWLRRSYTRWRSVG